jgi:hypothetical protein
MTKNRHIAEFMLSKMETFGYKPYDISYGNGYFICDYGEDSVVHFRVKGVWKHWKFGMWIFSDYLTKEENKDEYPFIQIFAQYDTQIDKFKPSRSDLCVKYNASDWDEAKEDNGLWFWELENMLDMMKRHPFMCYGGFCGEYAGYTDRCFLWDFVKYESKEHIQIARKVIMTAIYLPYTKAKIFFAKRNKCVKSIELYDFEKENPGWSTSYLYEVKIVFDEDSTDEKEIKWLNRWFKKERYGKYGYYKNVISLDGLHREGLKGMYSYAK